MPLFAKNKALAVQSFLVRMVNNNSPQMKLMVEGPRVDGRVHLTMPVWIVPIERGKPVVGKAFTAVTKEFSSTGASIVLDEPIGLDDLIVGFEFQDEMKFLRAVAKHITPLGGGFHQLGLQMTDIVHVAKYPQLKSLTL